jgi:hypothetical protein
MSIDEEIMLAIERGELVSALPSYPGLPEPRAFLMCRPLFEAIEAGRNSEELDRWAALESQISTFVEGGYVNWDFMRWLQPQDAEHWELRNTRPRPSLRVFGRFAKPNVFVGTHVTERKPLGGRNSHQWVAEVLRACPKRS